MATYTSYLNLEKPAVGETFNLLKINQNWDKIDQGVSALNSKMSSMRFFSSYIPATTKKLKISIPSGAGYCLVFTGYGIGSAYMSANYISISDATGTGSSAKIMPLGELTPTSISIASGVDEASVILTNNGNAYDVYVGVFQLTGTQNIQFSFPS